MSEAKSDLRIALLGATGRMGRAIARLVPETPGISLVAAVARPGSEGLGDDMGRLAGTSPLGVAVEASLADAVARADLLIDFSRPETLSESIRCCVGFERALVTGTTGHSAEQAAQLALAGEKIPVLAAPNMSAGVTLLTHLVEQAAAALGPEYDAEIVEMHHRHKADAPSGTALRLGEAVAAGRGVNLGDKAVFERYGRPGERPEGAIGFAALRGGDVIGDHSVIFAGPGERIELGHRASDRALFARGALKAAAWLRDKPAGLYGMKDVLGLC
jgi:4-hydroxy-tetrahydrodipicolinate reductase